MFAEANFAQPLLDQFDIVAWDPRGTGLSEPPIDCFSDYDHFFASSDITPDDAAGTTGTRRLGRGVHGGLRR